MGRPYGLLRVGYPYLKTLGMRLPTPFPVDIAFAKNDTLYLLLRQDWLALIRIWPLEDMATYTAELKSIGSFGTGDGQFLWPVQVIIDGGGDIFVSDEATNRITRFNEAGEFVSKWGTTGQGEGQFDGPTGIAFDPDANLVVVDSKNHRIQRYTPDGEYISGFGSHGSEPGQMDLPWGVHVDERGDIYVADWGNNRFQIFSNEGELKNVVGSPGCGDAQFHRPTGVAVDNHGDIYVADWGNDRVQMFNSEGHYLYSFRGDASLSRVAQAYMLTNARPNRQREMGRIEQEKYLARPRSVRIDDKFRLCIPDYERYRVQVYQKDFVTLDNTQYGPPQRNPTLVTM